MKDLSSIHNVLLDTLKDFDSFCQQNDIQYSLSCGSVLGAIRHKGFIPWDDDLDVMMTRENYDKFISIYEDNDKYILQKEQKDYPLYFSKLRKNGTTFIENIKYKKKWRNIHQGIYIDIFPADKVSRNRILGKIQGIFSNILITQSLFLRGYQTKNPAKLIFIFISILLLPFKNLMFKFITRFNQAENFDYYCCFSCNAKKWFINRDWMENINLIQFAGENVRCISNAEKYLEVVYGNWQIPPSESQRELKIHAKYFDANKDYKEFLK